MVGDTLAMADERIGGDPLLTPVMRGGKLLEPLPSLHDARAHATSQLAGMPAALHSLGAAQPYLPAVSQHLRELVRQVDERLSALAETDRAHWEIEAGRQGARPIIHPPPSREKGQP